MARPFVLLCLLAAASACTVTIRTFSSSSNCQGAFDSKTIVANNTCQYDGGEHVMAAIRRGALVTTYYESAECSATLISAEPTRYPRGQCADLGGGVSAIADWTDSAECESADSIDDLLMKQVSPCFWSDFYRLPGQSFQEFVCHEVQDNSAVVFDSSSDSGADSFSVAVFADKDFQAWLSGASAPCVNAECEVVDTQPKAGSVDVNADGSPYHVVITNPGQAGSTASFDVTISVSVGKSTPRPQAGVTGGPPPPPSPHPPPPHPSPPPPHPSPPPPHPSPPPPHPSPPPPHPSPPPPPHPSPPPPTPPPPHPSPPPPHPPPPPPPGPAVCAQLKAALPSYCHASPACTSVACAITVYDVPFGVSWDFACSSPVGLGLAVNQTEKNIAFSTKVPAPGGLVVVPNAIVNIPKIGDANLTIIANISGSATAFDAYIAAEACIQANNTLKCHPAAPWKMLSATLNFSGSNCTTVDADDLPVQIRPAIKRRPRSKIAE